MEKTARCSTGTISTACLPRATPHSLRAIYATTPRCRATRISAKSLHAKSIRSASSPTESHLRSRPSTYRIIPRNAAPTTLTLQISTNQDCLPNPKSAGEASCVVLTSPTSSRAISNMFSSGSLILFLTKITPIPKAATYTSTSGNSRKIYSKMASRATKTVCHTTAAQKTPVKRYGEGSAQRIL